MKEELNIAAILKEKPEGTKLWSPAVGKCCLRRIDDYHEWVYIETCGVMSYWFDKKGLLFGKGERLLFPSKQMRDWSKFAWKKGDVLRFSDILVIFEKWSKDDYTEFKAVYEFNCHSKSFGKGKDYYTSEFCKAIDETANNFVKKVEEHYGGKLNLETLDIKKPEFKDGDIVFVESPFIGIHTKSMIAILNKDTDDGCEFYLALCNKDYDGCTSLRVNPIIFNRMQAKKVRLATDSEKQQLFDALAKEGKRWNPDTLQVEDLPKKPEFKAMDWCLMRRQSCKWELCQYSYYDGNYHCVGGALFHEFLPYNDQTAHLLGTTDEWKGGEG